MVSILEWGEHLDVGVKEMNQQHQKLLGFMNVLFDVHTQGKKFEEIRPLVEEMLQFTIRHFKEEEDLMIQHNYPKLENHQMIHKQLLHKLHLYISHAESSGAFNDEFFQFLKFWISAHIQGIDKQYGEVIAPHLKEES